MQNESEKREWKMKRKNQRKLLPEVFRSSRVLHILHDRLHLSINRLMSIQVGFRAWLSHDERRHQSISIIYTKGEINTEYSIYER